MSKIHVFSGANSVRIEIEPDPDDIFPNEVSLLPDNAEELAELLCSAAAKAREADNG